MSRPEISTPCWLGSLTLSKLGFSLLLLVLTICFNVQTVRTVDKTSYTRNRETEVYNTGKAELESYKRRSEYPQYGECWTHALTKVYAGCKRLTDDERSRMAIALTNCHLERAGPPLFPCEDDENLENCLSPMRKDVVAFNTYTEFFTHTQDICFFLQSQVWHEHTEETISELAKSSEAVADQLEVTSHLQSEMIKKQNASMKNQEKILKNEEYLRKALNDSTKEVYILVEEMKSSIVQKKLLFDETFERLANIQRLIIRESTWIHSLLFYMAAILISYLLTSTPRTSGARLWMCLVFLLSWFAERAVFSFYEDTSEEVVIENLWRCRYVFIVIAAIFLIECLVRYKDYKEMNHKLLMELHDKVDSAVTTLEAVKDSAVATLEAVKDSSKMTITSSNGETSATVKKRGRPKGSKSSPPIDACNPSQTSFPTTYNLRSRRSFTPNRLFDQETVDMFIEKIER